jgi:hypothetical protein
LIVQTHCRAVTDLQFSNRGHTFKKLRIHLQHHTTNTECNTDPMGCDTLPTSQIARYP